MRTVLRVVKPHRSINWLVALIGEGFPLTVASPTAVCRFQGIELPATNAECVAGIVPRTPPPEKLFRQKVKRRPRAESAEAEENRQGEQVGNRDPPGF